MKHFGKGMYSKPGKPSKEIEFIILEFAPEGELFDFLSKGGAFSEELARYHFKNILDGIEHCHKKGVVHRDLKIENILLD